jgi:hypothetical protein
MRRAAKMSEKWRRYLESGEGIREMLFERNAVREKPEDDDNMQCVAQVSEYVFRDVRKTMLAP